MVVNSPTPPAPVSTSNPTNAKVGVAAAAGVAGGGVFTFGILQQLGMDQLFRSANTATSWLFALTTTCILILLILVTGYLLLLRDRPGKTAPVLWACVAIFGAIALTGFGTIVEMSLTDPVVNVEVRLRSGTKLADIQDTPPLQLKEYFNGDSNNPVPGTAKPPWTYPMRQSQPLIIDIDQFDVLKARYVDRAQAVKSLKYQLSGVPGYLGLAKGACIYVPHTADIYAPCVAILDQPS